MTVNLGLVGIIAPTNTGMHGNRQEPGSHADDLSFDDALNGRGANNRPMPKIADAGPDNRVMQSISSEFARELHTYPAEQKLPREDDATDEVALDHLVLPESEPTSMPVLSVELQASGVADMPAAASSDYDGAQIASERTAKDGTEVSTRAHSAPREQLWALPPRPAPTDPAHTARPAMASEIAPAATSGMVAEPRLARAAPTPPPVSTAPVGTNAQPVSLTTISEATEPRPEKGLAEPARFEGLKENIPTPNGKGQQATAHSDPLASRVNVLAFSATPAPAATAIQTLGPTAASLVDAIEGDASWRAAAETSGTQRPQAISQGTNTLRIQLNPAELGMVTARLTANGTQLSVEIQADSSDARQKLAGDSDAIVKALRAVGFDIDKVTISQTPQGTPTNAQQGSAFGRESSWSGNQTQGEAGANNKGREQASGHHGEGARHGQNEAAANNTGGGLYI